MNSPKTLQKLFKTNEPLKKGLKGVVLNCGSIPAIYRPPLGLKFPFGPSKLSASHATVRPRGVPVPLHGQENVTCTSLQYVRSNGTLYGRTYMTYLYLFEALDVSFPISVKRLGLIALGEL
ncbi:hypothetical protein PIB30_065860 [Stylosanthes scabra]|uniref:Uncharacterized protein n=1 Tax=Stylosanthes scabra TaxID=79078 RepID=A0ABU6ZKX1_9FABA|nr:hypothetical protein [Stylosanthes scabra]